MEVPDMVSYALPPGTAPLRVDFAARGGNLRLHLQGARNAPAGEGTHGVGTVEDCGADALDTVRLPS